MGTRGAMGFRIDGQDKVTYNHWDSYPSGLGMTILDEISKMSSVDEMRRIAKGIVLVDEDNPPTEEQKAASMEYLDLGVGEQSDDDWYCLLRDAQGGLSAWLTDGLTMMIDSHGFLADSLFCEWAYIINLDENVFEAYKGFQHTPGNGRYSGLLPSGRGYRTEPYYGVSLIATVPLDFILNRPIEELEEIISKWTSDEEDEDSALVVADDTPPGELDAGN